MYLQAIAILKEIYLRKLENYLENLEHIIKHVSLSISPFFYIKTITQVTPAAGNTEKGLQVVPLRNP